MRVIDINGQLATAGSWDETSQSEADAQARLRATRTGLRAMLAGNEAFHVDPMSAPAVSFTPSVIGIDGAGPNDSTAIVTYTRTGSTVRIDTVFTSMAPEPLNPHQIIADCTPVSGAALIGTKTEPEAEVWHTEAPTVAGVYLTRLLEPGGRTGPRWFDGTFYHALGGDGIDPRKCMCYGNNRDIQWSRLLEADTPAPAAQESEYLVCIKGSKWLKVGQIAHQVGGGFDPEYWARCDSEGWIPHQPTADAVCPVPDHVNFEIKIPGTRPEAWPGGRGNCNTINWGRGTSLTAWRPIQA